MTLRRLILGLCLAFSAALAAAAGDIGPVIPKATGSPHKQGNAYMIKHHMEMMMHGRDTVMRQGEKLPEHVSIGKCFNCHTVRDASGKPVTFQSPKHFCRVCHDFAAVRIDCFECHRSTPSDFQEPPLQARLNRPLDALPGRQSDQVQVVQNYLDSVTKTTEAMR